MHKANSFFHSACLWVQPGFWKLAWFGRLLPLTPALSPSDGERVDRRTSLGESQGSGAGASQASLLPLPV